MIRFLLVTFLITCFYLTPSSSVYADGGKNPLNPNDWIDDPRGFHGMVLFGEGRDIYLSHLAMYMNPHDYQVIVKVKLSDAVTNQIEELRKNGIKFFTLAPRSGFVLPQFAAGMVPEFPSTIIQGHFERGGDTIATSNVEFESLVYFRKVERKFKQPKREEYIVFGTPENHYMAHVIKGRPDYDQIFHIGLHPDPRIADGLQRNAYYNLACLSTSGQNKDLNGLSVSSPHNCIPIEETVTLEQKPCDRGITSLDDIRPSSSIKSIGGFSNLIGISTNYYTDSQDFIH